MNELEIEILEEAFFVVKYSDLVDGVGPQDMVEFDEAIISLLTEGNMHQMYFNEDAVEYEKQNEVHVANLNQYHYLASKKGMLELTGRS